ncbi:MAG: hypothetical protein LH609_11310 [Rudanella sp.]|nr:hypothetical protein [Rudanella sp.]
MKPSFTTLWLSILVLTGHISYAQETYFNVSESEISKKNKVLIQQQIDITDQFRSTTTFDYGLGRNWEIGFNLYNVNYPPDMTQFIRNDSSPRMPYAPPLRLNVQKVLD